VSWCETYNIWFRENQVKPAVQLKQNRARRAG
jgi:hypothetical protein